MAMIPEPLSAEQLAAIIRRDEDAGDGITIADSMVFLDRHALINEVQRLQAELRRAEDL
jgi:hypothetical protein